MTCSLLLRAAAVLSLAAIAVGMPTRGVAQTITQAADGTLSLDVRSVPLGTVMRQIREHGSFQKLVLDPRVERRPVTIALEGVTVRQAVVRLLNEAGVNYALTADEDGRAMRLIAGEVAFIAEAQRAMAREARAPRVKTLPLALPSYADGKVQEASEPQAASVSVHAVDVPDAPAPDAAFQAQQLEQALTMPVVKPPVGSVIELPFTDADGRVVTTVLQAKVPGGALPFPTSMPAPAAPDADKADSLAGTGLDKRR